MKEKLLKRVTKKYNFFFHQSNDSVFVVGMNGKIIDLNPSGIELLKCSNNSNSLNLFNLFYDQREKNKFWKQLKKEECIIDFKTKFITHNRDKIIDTLISANIVKDKKGKILGFQGILKDTVSTKKIKNIVTRTVLDTQEKERKRFAEDLHDSVSQQLSALKIYISTLQDLNFSSDSQSKYILSKSEESINNLLLEIRHICFNLIPDTLLNLGLNYAINELCNRIVLNNKLSFCLLMDPDFPILNKSIEVNIFRVVQEFITNSIKHGNATKISIRITNCKKINKVIVVLEDDGKGFEIKNLVEYNGMGLKNIKARVELLNGELKMESAFNKGTKFEITIPYIMTKKLQ